MPVSQLAEVLEHPNVQYVKEETPNAASNITEILKLAGATTAGVLGGGGAMSLPSEHRRGVCGTMPGAHIPEVFLATWNALEQDDPARARALMGKYLPLAMMELRFFPRLYKEVLVRRGVIKTAFVRTTGVPSLDSFDFEEMDALLYELRDFLTGPLPAG